MNKRSAGMAKEVDRKEARQATKGHGVRYVLLSSIVLAVIALAVVYLVVI